MDEGVLVNSIFFLVIALGASMGMILILSLSLAVMVLQDAWRERNAEKCKCGRPYPEYVSDILSVERVGSR